MKGLGKYLVGGILGAIFGFLVSPRRAQKIRDALFGKGLDSGYEGPVRVAIPPVAASAPVRASIEVEAPSPPAIAEAPMPATAPVPAPATEAIVEAPAPVAAVETPVQVAAPAAESFVDVSAPLAPVVAPEPVRAASYLQEVPPPEPAVTPDSEALPEPEPAWTPPRPAWTPAVVGSEVLTAASSDAEADLEPVAAPPGRSIQSGVMAALVTSASEPVDEESAPPAAAEPMLEEAPEPEPVFDMASAPGRVTIPGVQVEPAPEVLETPVDGSGWQDTQATIPSADALLEDLEPVPPVTALEEPVEPMPEPAFEPETERETEPLLEAVLEPEPMPEPEATPEAETVAEPETASATSSEVPSALASGPALDRAELRARIEDTRERIRRELEQSFAARAADQTPPESSPDSAQTVDGQVHGTAGPGDAPPEGRASDGSFDQEAMRRRIDETRNRLKAKAFDAMMSGEAALLSRAPSAQRPSVLPEVPLDKEVAESIEKTLTEEDV
jgi:hypothetical protein